MRLAEGYEGREETLIDVFRSAFSAAEGADEGEVIASLVRDVFTTTDPASLRVFSVQDDKLIAAVCFTRLFFPDDAQRVMLLSPMAVVPERWRQGVGQKLIAEALAALHREDVDIVLTYGDLNYYGQIGFLTVSATDAEPPVPLSMPHGWLGQRLGRSERPVLRGPSRCVEAFQNPSFW